MIKDQTLDEAIVEALRFVKAAKALRQVRKTSADRQDHHALGWFYGDQVREHAACKRASLDLTRKLADLRAGR